MKALFAAFVVLFLVLPHPQVFYDINDVRAEHDLPPLEWCDDLAAVASAHAEDMGVF